MTVAPMLSEGSIRAAVDRQTYQRGVAYARERRVREFELRPDGSLAATVEGSRGQDYYTQVSSPPTSRPGPRAWVGRCSCPMVMNCKHVVAVLLTARELLGVDEESVENPSLRPAAAAIAAVEQRPAWEEMLSGVVQSVSAPTGVGTPLALQVEVLGFGPGTRLRLKPLLRGKSGRWVRTGITWGSLASPYQAAGRTQAHVDVLSAMYQAFQAQRARTQSYYGYGEPTVHLDELGPQAWQLFRDLVDAGVELVVNGTANSIRVVEEPAQLWLDARRDDPTGADGGFTLRPSLTLDGEEVSSGVTNLVGDPPHGLIHHEADAPPGKGGVLRGVVLAALDRPVTPQVYRMLMAGPVTVPAADAERFAHEYYPALRKAIAVRSSDDSVALAEPELPVLTLDVRFNPAHQAVLTWGFGYPRGTDLAPKPFLPTGRADVGRDLDVEQSLVSGLLASEALPATLPELTASTDAGRRLVPRVELRGLAVAAVIDDLLPALADRNDVHVRVHGDAASYRRSDTAPLVEVATQDQQGGSDWFDLQVTVSIDGEPVPFQELFVALARGESHLLLDSGTYFSIDRPELVQLRALIEEARALSDRASGALRISAYQAGLWEELVELGVVSAQSERWTRVTEGLLSLDRLDPPSAPVGLQATLRPYQLEGFQWASFLQEQGLGGILADDMGLGKTLQALAVVAHAVEGAGAEPPPPFLVVAPTSVVSNWVREAARFAPDLSVTMVSETGRRRGRTLAELASGAAVVVTSYTLFRLEYDDYEALPWSGLVLDEAQFVKNHQGRAHQCARRLPAPFKLAITGTPMENNLMELWSLLSIVAPGLFPQPGRFAEYYARPIERDGDAERLSTLRRRIRPLMRRRTKEQVAPELPPKQEQVLEVQLNPRHQRVYATHLQRERQKVLGLIDDLDKNRFEIFRSITLLRQAALAPVLVDPAAGGITPSKIDALLEQLEDVLAEGHRALVFSQFTGFLRLVRERLDAERIRYCYLDGRTRDRARRVAEFKDGDAPLFLISLKSGGFGLNLTEADYVFVLDPWWNPAVEAQAVDRAHRIGQDKTVMVYRLVAEGTIEEKVMELKARKADLFTRVVDDGALMSAPLTVDDIRGLLDP